MVTIFDFLMIICAFGFSIRLWRFTRTLQYTTEEVEKLQKSIVGTMYAIEKDGLELQRVIGNRLLSDLHNQRDSDNHNDLKEII